MYQGEDLLNRFLTDLLNRLVSDFLSSDTEGLKRKLQQRYLEISRPLKCIICT